MGKSCTHPLTSTGVSSSPLDVQIDCEPASNDVSDGLLMTFSTKDALIFYWGKSNNGWERNDGEQYREKISG